MSSEIIVVLIIVAFAIGGMVVLERNSRRNGKREQGTPSSEE
jgi:hypothetical protein